MIFKHLFTPKWKHPKSQIRLAALENLDKERDAPILNQLAFEDNDAEIRKKALHKLNELSLWWQAYKQDNVLKELAEQQISQAVLSNDTRIDSTIKQEYVDRFAPVKTLEKLAFAEKELKVRSKLLKRLADAKLIERAFKEGNEEFQLLLVDLVITHQLAKGALKHAQGEAHTKLTEHLEEQRLAAEMPAKVNDACRLILAKLNALRDKHDYLVVDQHFNQLEQQWQALELKWLSAEQQQQIDQKRQPILTKLATHIAQLKAAYEQQQLQLQQQQRQVLALASLQALAEEIENALQLGLDEPEQIQQDWLEAKVNQAKDAMADNELANNDNVAAVKGKLEKLFLQVQQLPELTAAIGEFKKHLEALANVAVATEQAHYDQQFSEFQASVKQAKHSLAVIPKSLQTQFKAKLKETEQQWLQQVAAITTHLDKHQQQARRKARDVKRLIEQGRFNVAFGVFKGFEEHYNQLTPNYQATLNKFKDELQAQLTDANDWQKYASAPKREEMLDEVKALLDTPCEDVKKRVAEVKQLRRRWNELGRLDTEQEQLQGEQFDAMIEQLFSPCRLFFAEQDKQREQAKVQRQQLITQLQTLAQKVNDLPAKQLDAEFTKLQKAWRNAGQVDAKTYRTLMTEFKAVQAPVQELIKQHQQSNAEQKSDLIEQAKRLQNSDDLAAACQQLKELQTQWQQLGFAGQKVEHSLWQTFRKINDETFAKRSEQYESAQRQAKQSEDEASEHLSELESLLDSLDQRSQLNDLLAKLHELDYPKSLAMRVTEFEKQVKHKQQQLSQQAKQQQLTLLFNALEQQQAIPSQFEADVSCQLTAEQLLVRMEILAGVELANASLRMSEQVLMLDDKHNGEQADINYYLKQYLALSESSVDGDTLARLRTIFA